MSVLYIYCEGSTEKIFADKILAPFLSNQGIYIQTILSGEGRSGKRGGVASYDQIRRELLRICREHHNEYVTTMIDYSPEVTVPFDYDKKGTVFDQVCSKEIAIENDLNMPNLIMNFELHEFEAYLFCNPDAFEKYGRKAPQMIRKIIDDAKGPELINTTPNTLPSRRLDDIIPNYTNTKKLHTTQILEHISLEQIRSKCSHFDKWLTNVCNKCKNRG